MLRHKIIYNEWFEGSLSFLYNKLDSHENKNYKCHSLLIIILQTTNLKF